MKHFFMSLIMLCFSCSLFGQGIDNVDKPYTVYDLYKWRNQMNFQPKFFDTKTFDNYLLKLDQRILDQWQITLSVAHENNLRGDDSMMFVYRKQFEELYGAISEDKFNKWYQPYYVFTQLDLWAKEYILKNKGKLE